MVTISNMNEEKIQEQEKDEYLDYIREKIRFLSELITKTSLGDFSYKLPKMRLDDKYTDIDSAFRDIAEVVREKEVSLNQTKVSSLNLLEDLQDLNAKVEAARLRNAAIIESIGEGIIVTDEYGRITRVNKTGEGLLGLNEEDLLGKYLLDVISLLNNDKTPISKNSNVIVEALAGGTAMRDNLFVRKKGGEESEDVPVSIVASPFLLNNEPLGVVVVIRDITLERQVDVAKTEFVSLASHQLRTPLSAINWYSEMLLDGDAGELNENQRKYMLEVYHGSKRMVDLVNALLNVSRVDLGTFAVDPSVIDLKEITESVLDELKPKIVEKKMNIEKEFDSEVTKITADAKIMRIVIQNLLSNSVKYTPAEGTVGIKITKEDKHLLITVYDNGLGIPEEQQKKIFTKLFRADNARDVDSDGTGLGLYLVKGIVDQASGKIWFESEVNKGTTFYVKLPLEGIAKGRGGKGSKKLT